MNKQSETFPLKVFMFLIAAFAVVIAAGNTAVYFSLNITAQPHAGSAAIKGIIVSSITAIVVSFVLTRYLRLYSTEIPEKVKNESNQIVNNDRRQTKHKTSLEPLSLSVFNEVFDAELAKSNAHRSVCLIMIDIKNFKEINHKYSQHVGDALLSEFGTFIKSSLRKEDQVAKYTGDQFICMIPNTNKAKGILTAKRIKKLIEEHSFRALINDHKDNENTIYESHNINIEVSIGIVCNQHEHLNRSGMIMAADIALSKAKSIPSKPISMYDANTLGDEGIKPQELYEIINNPTAQAIESLADIVDERDIYTKGHSFRVSNYSVDIAEKMGLEPSEVEIIRLGGLLHDLGKLGISSTILNKEGELSQDERQFIEQHPAIGYSLLRRSPKLEKIIPAVLYHHERIDGSGYPGSLPGESIPLIAKIVAVADAFDAMTTNRPYRLALTSEFAIQNIKRLSGVHFDSNVVKAFLEYHNNQNTIAA